MVLNVCFEVTLFRELDELDKSKFDLASMSFSGKFESPVEKKLRETGESLETWTQSSFRDSGNHFSNSILCDFMFNLDSSVGKSNMFCLYVHYLWRDC